MPSKGPTTLPFTTTPPLDMNLSFLPMLSPPAFRKRGRAAADVDGEHSCLQKKKRRLRLFLITSRLSPQFSHPASNIVDRGSSKIAVWAKQKALGRNLLRKAAILNGIRRRTTLVREPYGVCGRVSIAQEKEEAQLELARLEFNHGSVDTYTRPVLSRDPSVPPSAAIRTGDHFVVSGSPSSSPNSSRSPSPILKGSGETTSFRSPNEAWALGPSPPGGQSPRKDYLPLPPSPLGVSNYDALDAEASAVDLYDHLDDEDDLFPSPFDDEDDDVPFSPSAVTTNSSLTVQTGTTYATTMFSDYNVLDHGQPVFGDYDQIEGEADTQWPDTCTQDTPASNLPMPSPNLSALLATSQTPAKRTDSFATSPNFRPCMPMKSVSPDMAVVTSVAPASPNFTSSTSLSPNFAPVATSPNFASAVATTSMSPNFPPLAAPTSASPNFTALDAPMAPSPSLVTKKNQQRARAEVVTPNRTMEQERRRQRDLMFMHFGP
ncbi:hypothetical protein DDE82_005056 [Stemphylium lycopersici]|uniref:Uncharacterized protein n=1 Tax=Stemphylium lycopersici TaxID=183478 RepID=A0A364N7A0_STELY|nr:hypothetical protein TW65_05438 [Stemphylium lycopersici]RAR03566.1 hypothetical protein DDE82_005056 [Stemphylium lycopersici]RAR12911.1 hypothetical protein DDE83_003709 [Stemphylium lycopersici]